MAKDGVRLHQRRNRRRRRGGATMTRVKPLGSFNIDTSQRWVSPPISPHFGHQVLQHSDGRQSWLYKCYLQNEIHCEEAGLGENIQKLKKIQPGIALAQSPEQILACIQQKRRQLRKATEELNGLCVLLAKDFQEKAFLNLTSIIRTALNQTGQRRSKRSDESDGIDQGEDTDIKSSAAHAGGFTGGAATSACQDPDTHKGREKDCPEGGLELGHKTFNVNNNNNYMVEEEEEDDSDLRTEIAIVLDGSGSIEPEDFERAKDFIYNVLKMFYAKCFECAFALVQYGAVIQTEFDLQDGRDTNTALAKVRGVTQVGNVTRTASAIQHVLDSIFHESHGSQKNAAKIIVVLTDGEIFLDPMNLTSVINSKSMAGIDRYAIGVGNAFKKTKALDELRLIASDPDETHLFQVTNYSALNALLSTLQQKIIGIEGTAGDVLEFELAQSGFSTHLLDERYVLFGTVGAFDWSGGILLYDIASKTAVFLNESKEATGGRNSYLGYSVVAVSTRQGALIVAGAPRHSMTGRVMVFEGDLLKQTLHGEQIGSYFGAVLCPLDIDQDGLTDHLLVGAPFFHVFGEEGKVYIYRFDNEANLFALEGHLSGQPAVAFASFGFAVASIGDVDQDGYGDVAIGAPLEHHKADPSSFGSVYIYNGKKDGIRGPFSQRITATQLGQGLMHFGRSVAGGLDFTADGLPDIAVGSLGRVTLLRSRPVFRLDAIMQFTPERISSFYNSSTVAAKLCFHRTFPPETAQPGMRNLIIRFNVDLDVEMEKKRVQFEDHATTLSHAISFTEHPCAALQLYVLPCNNNCFSSVAFRLSYRLHSSSEDLNDPMPILDIYRESEMYFQLPYKDDCGNKTVCTPHLTLAVHTEKNLVVGATKELTMNLHLANTGDNSYLTSVVLEYPENLCFKKVQEYSTPSSGGELLSEDRISSATIDCDAPKPTKPQFSSLNCKIGHPVFRTTANFSVIWQLEERKFPNDSPSITVNLSNTNPNSTTLIEEHFFNVKYAFSTFLSRPDPILYVNMSKRASQNTRFEFNINGKNPYGVQLELQVWVPALIDSHQVIHVKNATGTQKTTVCRTARDFIRKDSGHASSENSGTVQYQLVTCAIVSEKENVIVTAELTSANSLQVLKNRTGLLVTGEIIFNRDLYVGLNERLHKTQLDTRI
ncbi:PREDICTED: integrin alpha-E [Gekko japonicus]|uniref:Integrin alpha-E n=1 Tax=Gekko japonicus TaxID=146911 RepID=A0ABM1JLM3_GEKJA|nr:PREDICTED: integrin alpha-E [Gekko japonicus]